MKISPPFICCAAPGAVPAILAVFLGVAFAAPPQQGNNSPNSPPPPPPVKATVTTPQNLSKPPAAVQPGKPPASAIPNSSAPGPADVGKPRMVTPRPAPQVVPSLGKRPGANALPNVPAVPQAPEMPNLGDSIGVRPGQPNLPEAGNMPGQRRGQPPFNLPNKGAIPPPPLFRDHVQRTVTETRTVTKRVPIQDDDAGPEPQVGSASAGDADSSAEDVGARQIGNLGNMVSDVRMGAFREIITEMEDRAADLQGLAESMGFDLGFDSSEPQMDLGLVGSGDGSGALGSLDAEDLFGNIPGEDSGFTYERPEGLPLPSELPDSSENAPPTGWGHWGGFASMEGPEYDSESADMRTEDGLQTTTVTRKNHTTGEVRIDTVQENPNGTITVTTNRREESGFSTTHWTRYDGNRAVERGWHDSQGRSDLDRLARREFHRRRMMEENPSPDGPMTESERAWARWLWGRHNAGRHSPQGKNPIPIYVNPGDPDYEGAGMEHVPWIWAHLDWDLRVNPDPEQSRSSGGRLPSRQEMQEVLSGPGPGARPPRDGDGRSLKSGLGAVEAAVESTGTE